MRCLCLHNTETRSFTTTTSHYDDDDWSNFHFGVCVGTEYYGNAMAANTCYTMVGLSWSGGATWIALNLLLRLQSEKQKIKPHCNCSSLLIPFCPFAHSCITFCFFWFSIGYTQPHSRTKLTSISPKAIQSFDDRQYNIFFFTENFNSSNFFFNFFPLSLADGVDGQFSNCSRPMHRIDLLHVNWIIEFAGKGKVNFLTFECKQQATVLGLHSLEWMAFAEQIAFESIDISLEWSSE